MSFWNDIEDFFTGGGDEVVNTVNSTVETVADGAVQGYQQAAGGVVYAIDWTQTTDDGVQGWLQNTTGKVEGFSVDTYNQVKPAALQAWAMLSDLVASSPPALGPYNPLAKSFMKDFLTFFVGGTTNAESVIQSWERDARSKGYTMAIGFRANVNLGPTYAEAPAGVYVDNTGQWGFYAQVNTGVGLTLSAGASITVDLWMLFGGVSRYTGSYLMFGGEFDINGFIIGGSVLVTSGFDFVGFNTAMGFGVENSLFGTGSNPPPPNTTKPSFSPGLPTIDVYSTGSLTGQAPSYNAACQTAKAPTTEKAIVTNATVAGTLTSPSVLLSTQYGGGGGNPFADDMSGVDRITSIEIRAGKYVDRIATTYLLANGDSRTVSHGGSGGSQSTIKFDPDERIMQVSGRSGKYLDQISIKTNKRTLGPYGGGGGSPFTITCLPNQQMLGFFGRSGNIVDALGVFYQTGLYCTLAAQHSKKYLSTPLASALTPGSAVVQNGNNPEAGGAFNGVDSQEWLLVPTATTDYYYIRQKASGLHLEPSSTTQSAALVLNNPSAADSQLWQLQPNGNAAVTYSITNKATGMVMDVSGANRNEDAAVIQWPASGASNQQWKLDIVRPRVSVYDQPGFTGAGVNLSPGRYNLRETTLVRDNAIQSVRVPEGWRVTLYADASSTAARRVLTGNTLHLGSMNNQTSIIEIEMPPWGAAVYTGSNYQGSKQTFPPGKYDLSKFTIGNDSIQSVQVPEGWRVTLFQHSGFGGDVRALTSNQPDLGNFKSVTSSLVVEAAPPGQAVVFTESNYGGNYQIFTPGNYNMNQLTVGNDTIRSLKAPAGWTVILYEHGNFGGATLTLTSSTYDLGSFNAKTSSLRVIPG